MTTTVINLKKGFGTIGPKCLFKDVKEWQESNPDHIYIGRQMRIHVPRATGGIYTLKQSKYHNPFRKSDYPNQDVIQMYKEYLSQHPKLVREAVDELEGAILGCWCVKPHHPTEIVCHGQILIQAMENLKQEYKKSHSPWSPE